MYCLAFLLFSDLKLSPRAVNRSRIHIRHASRWAVDGGLLSHFAKSWKSRKHSRQFWRRGNGIFTQCQANRREILIKRCVDTWLGHWTSIGKQDMFMERCGNLHLYIAIIYMVVGRFGRFLWLTHCLTLLYGSDCSSCLHKIACRKKQKKERWIDK